jgi:hypothetical protein
MRRAIVCAVVVAGFASFGAKLCFATALVILTIAPAAAAESSNALDLRPLLTETVIPILSTALLALGLAAIAWLRRRLGIEDNRALGEIADKALVRGVQFAENALRAEVANGGWAQPAIESELVRRAAAYVTQQIPDTLRQLGYDPATPEGRAAIDRMIRARLSPPASP